MRDGWTETTLGELCELYQPETISKAKMEDTAPYIVYGANGPVGRYSRFNHEEPEVVVTCRGATCGVVNMTPPNCWITGNAMVVKPRDNRSIKGFLFWALQISVDVQATISGSAQPQITRTGLAPSKIQVPPLDEQKRIVDLVSSVENYIGALQQQADTARTARNAVLHELLSAGGDDWTETTLGEVGASGLFSDGDWVESKDQDPEGAYRLLQLADIGDGVFLDKSSRWLNEEQFQRLRCTALVPGDILIARMPDPIARACLFPNDLPVSSTVVDVAILRCGLSHFPKFLVMLINDVTFRAAANSLITGTTRQRISRSNLSALSFSLPPIDEQNRIVEIVSSMDDVVRSTEQAVTDAKNLRSGLLSDLLSGNHEIPASYGSLLGAA